MSEVITDQRSYGHVSLSARLIRDQVPLACAYRSGQFKPTGVEVTVLLTNKGVKIDSVDVSGPMVLDSGELSTKRTHSMPFAWENDRVAAWGHGVALPGVDVNTAVRELVAAWITETRLALETMEGQL